MPAFVHLQVDGANLPGRSTFSELANYDLVDHSQIVAFYQDTSVGAPGPSGASSGRAVPSPFSIVKSLDGISPALQGALRENAWVNSKIVFFDQDPDTGVPRLTHSIILLQAKISAIRHEMQHGGLTDPSVPLERISITPTTVRYLSETNSAEYEYNLSSGA